MATMMTPMVTLSKKTVATMKKLMKSLMLFAAAAMALTSCENEVMDSIQESEAYTMNFVAGAPESRTSVSIDGTTANFAWSTGDKVGFYKVANDVDPTTEKAVQKKNSNAATIASDGTATFSVTFDSAEGATTYNIAAFYPGGSWVNHASENHFNNVKVKIPAEQVLTNGTFDPAADLLMSKPFMGVALDSDVKTLQFQRLAAIGRMNLKGVFDNETINSVVIEFCDFDVNGEVSLDMENSTFEFGTANTSNTITLNGELTATAAGTPVFFTCFPGDYSGDYAITVNTDAATYYKEGVIDATKPLAFTSGDVRGFGVTFTEENRTEKVVATDIIIDVLNRALTGISGSNYTSWSNKTSNSDAVYAGQSAGGNEAIQLRSNNSNSGIITTTSGGKVAKVVVTWQSATASGRTLDIYGKNTAYTNPTDLYNTSTQGTKLGSIKKGTSTELVITGDYEFIGMRSNSGAMYLSEVEIHWTVESDGLTAQTLAFSEEQVTYKMGSEFTEPELTGAMTTVTYASNNENIATVANDGKVTFVGGYGEVIITATAAEENGYREAKASYTIKVEQASIEEVTIAAFAAKKVDANVFYRISGTVEKVVDTSYGNFDLVDETGRIYVYGLYASKGSSTTVWTKNGLKEGDFLTIEATVGEYKGTKQAAGSYYISHYGISATAPAEAVSYEGGEASFSITLPEGVDGTLEATCDDEFVNDWEVNGNTVTVFLSENTEVTARTATIKVTYGKVFTTVYINQEGKPNDSGEVVLVDGTLSFANKAQRTSFSTTKQVWQQNGITFTNNKSASTNNVADYANPVRLYQNSQIIVEAPGNIKKIVFDTNSTTYATALKNSIGTVTGATVTVSSDKVTVEFATPSSKSHTIAKLTAQVRLDSLTVTYEQ